MRRLTKDEKHILQEAARIKRRMNEMEALPYDQLETEIMEELANINPVLELDGFFSTGSEPQLNYEGKANLSEFGTVNIVVIVISLESLLDKDFLAKERFTNLLQNKFVHVQVFDSKGEVELYIDAGLGYKKSSRNPIGWE